MKPKDYYEEVEDCLEDEDTFICSYCNGSGLGYTPHSRCRACNGSGEDQRSAVEYDDGDDYYQGD